MHPAFGRYNLGDRLLAYTLFQTLDPAPDHRQAGGNPDGYRIFLADHADNLAYYACPLGLCEFIVNRGRMRPENLLARNLLSDRDASEFIDAYDGGSIDDLADAMGLTD